MGYPIILELSDRRVLVVGAGAVATRRIERLLEEGAEVIVISPSATKTVAGWAEAGKLVWHRRRYRPGDCQSSYLVFAATDDVALNEQIVRDAAGCGALTNSATEAPSDFAVPSRIQRGPIQLTVDTGGGAPALSRQLRTELEAWLSDAWSRAASMLAELRATLEGRADSEQRQQLQRQAAAEIIGVLDAGGDVAAWLDGLSRDHGFELTAPELGEIAAAGSAAAPE
ncbi:MAG: precorrin-2 dehydrogenase/sirohydrochlorin ferrochelatase family protein [Persicimonas sp.]